MRYETVRMFGEEYVLTNDEIDFHRSLAPLFAEEIEHALALKQRFNLTVREDLLVLFVQMYLRRFAIPYFMLLERRFPTISDAVFLREILFTCMVGRAVDDIVDRDSVMFTAPESLVLQAVYGDRLRDLLPVAQFEKFREYLFESAQYVSPTIERDVEYEDLEHDVYMRIRYFFSRSEHYQDTSREWLKTYVGVLLSHLDLNDALADGHGQFSSTVMSNNLWKRHLNDENKVLLNEELLTFYRSMRERIGFVQNRLIAVLESLELHYVANILRRAGRL